MVDDTKDMSDFRQLLLFSLQKVTGLIVSPFFSNLTDLELKFLLNLIPFPYSNVHHL